MSNKSTVSKQFLGDVAEYTSFLDNWLPSERWRSTEPTMLLKSGVLTSAEIAYVLLRFGRFHASNWEKWRGRGFVALDSAINEVLLQIKNLLNAKRIALSAEEPRNVAIVAESVQGLLSILSEEQPGKFFPYTQFSLLYPWRFMPCSVLKDTKSVLCLYTQPKPRGMVVRGEQSY